MRAFLLVPLLAACATGRSATVQAPRVDYHQHLVSPPFAPIVKLPVRDGKKLLAELDAAGIDKAVVLSVGYSFTDERKKLDDPDRLTRDENDWTSVQVAASGGRLIGFCSANPLRPAALEELKRCLALRGMKGIKLRNIYFDVATVVTAETTPEEAALVAKRIRQVGAERVLYGSDLSPPGGSVGSGWQIFRDRVPLTAAEFRIIANNLTRFAR